MREKTVINGLGGQGVISMGQLWVYFAAQKGLEVSFFPVYGAEKRGGMARASVIVSDSPILSPVISQADSLVAMSPGALPECYAMGRPGAIFLYNSSMIKEKPNHPDYHYVSLACTELAESIGDVRVSNMIVLGALAGLTKVFTIEKAEEILQSYFPPKKHQLVPLNVRALEVGMEAVSIHV